MTYAIKFDLSVDDDRILSHEDIVVLLSYALDAPTVDVSNVELLEIND